LVEMESFLIHRSSVLQRESLKAIVVYFSNTTPPFHLEDYLEETKTPTVLHELLRTKLIDCAKQGRPLTEIDGFGSQICRATTLDISGIPPSSRSRDLGYIAQCIVVEMARVNRYRKELVTATSAAHLRNSLANAIAKETTGVTVRGKTVFEWEFWDGLACEDLDNIATSTDESSMRLAREIHVSTTLPRAQRADIANIIKTIEDSDVSTLGGKKGDAIEENVANAATVLVNVSALLPAPSMLLIGLMHRLCVITPHASDSGRSTGRISGFELTWMK
jgi:hypothetical protein